MHLAKLFQLYLEQAKKRVLTFFDNERRRACQWIKKIELAPNSEEEDIKLKLHSLKLLLLSLESNCLIGPFEDSPVDEKEFTQYDWYSYELTNFSNMIRSKKDKCTCPEISYAVSGNRREFVTYQDDQDTGQHSYYACSRRPIEEWRNLESGVIVNESIDQWKERGELEELNGKESTTSSVDIPRCVMHTTSSGIDFNPNDERCSDRNPSCCQNAPHFSKKSNCFTGGPSKQTNYRAHTERPETPQRFGGRGQKTMPYVAEQFGLSQNEQFHSPRGVFQNLDYDRSQTHRSSMPTRLTEEVIDSFNNARFRRGPLSEVKHNNDARQQLCARLQKVRDGMNKKPQVEIQQQEIEVEPDMVPYERIILQEPCEDINSRYQETEQDLGILSEAEMNDEVLFGEHETIDPRTIFKNKDENLVSRNVVTIETNTTINGSRREVTEEILEKEDVNVVERSDEDENLENVSEPTFKSVLGEQWKSKPRRLLADYSNLTQEDLDDISKPSFQQESFCQQQREDENRFYSERQQDLSQKSMLRGERRPVTDFEQLDDVSQPECSTTIDDSRVSAHVNASERLEDISHPDFAPCSAAEQGHMSSINQRLRKQADQSRRFIRQEPLCYGQESENLDDIEQPDYQSFNNSSIQTRTSKGLSSHRQVPHRHLYHVEASERLDEVSQPSFLHSTEKSYHESTNKTKCPTRQRPLPQVETSERLDQVTHPRLMSSMENPNENLTRTNRQRVISQVNTSERLDQIKHPDFVDSFKHSRGPFRQGREMTPHCRLPQVEASERLDEISEPNFLHSTGVSYQDSRRRTGCPRNFRPLSQVETSEKIDQISHPAFLSSFEESRIKCPSSQRPFPQADTSEELDQISCPSYRDSFQDSKVPSRRDRCDLSHKRFPVVEISERLDEVSQPGFSYSADVSNQDSTRSGRCPKSQRPLPEIKTAERIDQVSQPRFLSLEDNNQECRRKCLCPSRQRPLPQVNMSERLDQVSHPSFMASFQESTIPTKRGLSPHSRLFKDETSEKLDDVSQPGFLHSTKLFYLDSTERTRCPMRQRPLPEMETSERIDHVSHPSFVDSFQESSVPPRRGLSPHGRLMHQVETSEKLDEVSQPGFLNSTEVSYQDSTRRTRCPTNQRPLPEMETSERIDQVSQPEFLTSIENTYGDSRRRWKCPLSKRVLPQVEISERLEQISKPSQMDSFRDSSLQSGGRSEKSTNRLPPQIETRERLSQVSHPKYPSSFEESTDSKRMQRDIFNTKHNDSEMLDNVCQPEFQSSYEDTSLRSKGKMQTITPELLPHVDDSEWLDDVCHPEYSSNLQTSSIRNAEYRSLTSKQKHTPPVDDFERLENICPPEFPSSFEDSMQQSRRHTQGRHSKPQTNISERLDNINQPFCPSSLEDSIQSLEESIEIPVISNQVCPRDSSPKPVKNTRGQKALPQVDESEILDAVIQPDLTSFEDTGYGSQDKELEMLEDVSQPIFQSSYGDSTLKSRKTRHTQNERTLPFVDNSERLDDICELDYPSSFATSYRSGQNRKSMESEKLENVCQPSFQSGFEDSNRGINRCVDATHPVRLFQESSQMSRRSKQDPRQRLLSRIGTSEILDDISQPSSFGASMADRESRNISSQRPLFRDEESKIWYSIPQRPHHEESRTEHLDNVTQPSFQSSLKDSRNTQTPQRRRWIEIDISEKLNDVSQPSCPSCFQDTMKNSQRQPETPNRRQFPVIDVSENLEDICHPSFLSSFEESSNKSIRCENMRMQRPFRQIDESVKLDDISQPDFASTLKHSTGKSKGSRHYHSGRPLSVRNDQSLNNRPPQIDISERLNDISQPDFVNSVESTVPRSVCLSEQVELSKHNTRQKPYPEIDVSKRLEDVTQPSFPISLEESKRYSRRNDSRSNQESFPRESNLDRYHIGSRRYFPPQQFNTSEKLEDIVQPDFPSTFQESSKRAMPQIDLSENIESVCQPEFPMSFEDSNRNDFQNPPLTTYRKNKDCVKNYPKENLADISAPTFHSNYEESTQRSRGNSYLPQENLEDISCPSFQTTPKLPPRCQREESQSRRGPPRQLFPREYPNRERVERPGDFRQVFESMPNYAPFEEQVASKRNPTASRLKMPVTFAPPMAHPMGKNDRFCEPDLVYPGQQAQRLQHEAIKMNTRQFSVPSNNQNPFPTEDFCANRMRPPSRDINPMESKRPTRAVSSTKIPLPPSARTQTNVQHQEQRSKAGKSSENQERLVKKSSVKFHQTKSTYFKNKQDKSNKR